MTHAFTWKDKVDMFLTGVVAPIVSGNFNEAKAYLSRTPEQKYFAISDESGLSQALSPERFRGSVESIIRQARIEMITAELCNAYNLPCIRWPDGELSFYTSREMAEKIPGRVLNFAYKQV